MECEPSKNDTTIPSGGDAKFEIPDALASYEFETIHLEALRDLAIIVENRIYSDQEFDNFEKLVMLATLNAERTTPSQFDDNQRQLLKLTVTFKLFCGRDQFAEVMLDILKHNRELITDLIKSRTILTKSCKMEFLQLYKKIHNLASFGRCHQNLSDEELSHILQIENSTENLDNSNAVQTVSKRTLTKIKTSLASITDESIINDPLLKNHEASRIRAEISDRVIDG